jgi:hypothetical protein
MGQPKMNAEVHIIPSAGNHKYTITELIAQQQPFTYFPNKHESLIILIVNKMQNKCTFISGNPSKAK